MPESVPALEANMALLGMRRDGEGAEAMARRIVALVPGHRNAQMRIVDRLVARDPDAAFAHIQSLMAQTQDLEARYELRDWLAHTRLRARSEEHTSELQSLMRISYAVFCLKKKKHRNHQLK